MSVIASTDADRYPLLGAAGQRMLEFLREHPSAPIYRNRSGHRLRADDLEWVRCQEDEVLGGRVGWRPGTKPDWLPDFVAECRGAVPHYGRYPGAGGFESLPTTCRADFTHDIAAFVPDHIALERLITFQTSGTTGHPLWVPSHPRVAAAYLAYHKRALRRFGVTLTAGPGEVGVVLLGFQQTCFTYVSVTPAMNEAGLAKLNLHPDDWRDAGDRARYLEALAPEVIAGDPLSFGELLRIAPRLRPKAVLSTAMTLLDGLRERLAAEYRCPVLDLYSLNEAGPVGVFDPVAGGHVLLQPRMFVEILDPAGHVLPAGARGEITLTGGFNFCLPLLRYRTGDFASLQWQDDAPVLCGLEGRPAVRFQRADGTWFNNVDVTHALRPLALTRFSLHQQRDGTFGFSAEGPAAACREAEETVARLCGSASPFRIVSFPAGRGKVVQYSSDFPSGTL